MGRGAGAAGAQALTWRQVPRISLVSAHRATALTPQTLGLSGLVLVALVAAAYTYLSLSSMKTEVEVLTKDLDRFTGQVSQARDSLSEVESELGAVVQQIKELDGAGGAEEQALEELRASRTDWAYALEALLGVDSPDVKISKVVAEPGAKLVVTLNASGVRAIGTFQDHMKSVEDILDLGTLNSAPTESGFTISAEIRVR